MVVEHIPSPLESQVYRVPKFWPGISHANDESIPLPLPSTAVTELSVQQRQRRLAQAVIACDSHPSQDVLVFVAKMIDVGSGAFAGGSSSAVLIEGSITAEQKRSFQSMRQGYVRGKFNKPAKPAAVKSVEIEEDDKHKKSKAKAAGKHKEDGM
jgi:hypothetical protein